MNVGVCTLKLRLSEADNLKQKRRVLNSLCSRVRSRFNVAIAEVDDNESSHTATMGVSCISNSTRHVEALVNSVVNYIENSHHDVMIVEVDQEILTGY